jgi:hypothetical protein
MENHIKSQQSALEKIPTLRSKLTQLANARRLAASAPRPDRAAAVAARFSSISARSQVLTAAPRYRLFADSLQERAGFEPSVPRQKDLCKHPRLPSIASARCSTAMGSAPESSVRNDSPLEGDGFEPSVPRLRSLAEFVKPRSPPRPFRAGGVGRARAPPDSPRTKPSLPSRATFKISREDRDRSGQNSGREWDSLIKPETSLIADLNSLQGRIIFVRMRRELASNRFGIEVIPAFRGEKVSERVAAE